MDEKPQKPRAFAGGATVALVAAIILVALYVLSFGPAWWAVQKGYMLQTTMWKIYYPIVWLAAKSESVQVVVEWYAQLWLPPWDEP